MSTRSSIWYGEADGKEVHIYWELAERERENGQMVGAPIYMEVSNVSRTNGIPVRLPKEIGEALLVVLSPDSIGRQGCKVF